MTWSPYESMTEVFKLAGTFLKSANSVVAKSSKRARTVYSATISTIATLMELINKEIAKDYRHHRDEFKKRDAIDTEKEDAEKRKLIAEAADRENEVTLAKQKEEIELRRQEEELRLELERKQTENEEAKFELQKKMEQWEIEKQAKVEAANQELIDALEELRRQGGEAYFEVNPSHIDKRLSGEKLAFVDLANSSNISVITVGHSHGAAVAEAISKGSFVSGGISDVQSGPIWNSFIQNPAPDTHSQEERYVFKRQNPALDTQSNKESDSVESDTEPDES